MGGALSRTFLRIDEMLWDEKNREEILSYKENGNSDDFYAGCTANVAIIKEGVIYVANAGDSRCCIGNNGQLVKLSKDHKPDDPLEKQRICDANGFVSLGRVNANLNLSRALGDLEYKKNKELSVEKQLIICVPDIKSRNLDPNDEFIIIGCDGIWET